MSGRVNKYKLLNSDNKANLINCITFRLSRHFDEIALPSTNTLNDIIKAKKAVCLLGIQNEKSALNKIPKGFWKVMNLWSDLLKALPRALCCRIKFAFLFKPSYYQVISLTFCTQRKLSCIHLEKKPLATAVGNWAAVWEILLSWRSDSNFRLSSFPFLSTRWVQINETRSKAAPVRLKRPRWVIRHATFRRNCTSVQPWTMGYEQSPSRETLNSDQEWCGGY